MIPQFPPKLVVLFCLVVPIAFQGQNATAQGYQARRIPMILDAGGGFHLCKAKVDGKDAHLLVDSGANMEVTMTKDWATAEGKELKPSSSAADGIAGKAELFTTTFDSVDVGGAIELRGLTAMVMELKLGIPFAKQADGTIPKVDGLLGSRFLMNSQAVVNYVDQNLDIPVKGMKGKEFLQESLTAGKQVIPLKGGDEAQAVLEGIFKQHYQEIPLTWSKDGHYFVKVAINGKDRWMCLDSGADGILLDRKIAKEDGIDLTEAGTATGADGKSQASFRGTVKVFSVGANSFDEANMTFLDLSGFSGLEMPDGTIHPSAGQLGLAYLRSLPIAVDFPKSRILVAISNIKGGLAGIRKQTGELTAPMLEDDKGRHYIVTETMGKKALFLVDCGSRSCILFEQAAKDLKLETRDIEGSFNTLGNRGIPRKGATLSELKLGEHKINGNVEVVVLPGTGTEEVDGVPVIGIMGCAMFEVFKSSVDFHTNEVTLATDQIAK